MGYVGNSPAANFASVTKDLFSGDGSTTAFTLSKAATTNGVAVFVENVRQEPTTAYAVSGTTLTFTAAPVSASGNNIYVLHHNAPASTANHPAGQSLTAVNGTLTGTLGVTGESTLTGDATLSRSNQNGTVRLNLENTGAGGSTDYSEIKFNSTAGSTVTSIVQHRNNSGMNIGTSTAHPLTLITSGNTAMSVDANGNITMPLQPLMNSVRTGDRLTAAGSQANTIIPFTEQVDVGNDFASNIFTCPVDGKYFLSFFGMVLNASADGYGSVDIRKNSSAVFTAYKGTASATGDNIAASGIFNCSANDTISCFFNGGTTNSKLHEGQFGGFSVHLIA